MSNARNINSAATQSWAFSDIKIPPGLHINLQPTNSKTNHRVQYIGALPGKSLITTLPGELDGLWLKPTDIFILRGLVNTHAFAINCRPISISTTPYLHIHFSYPGTVQVRQARCCPRVLLTLPVEVTRSDASVQMAMLSDISIAGAGISSRVSLGATGDIINTQIPIILETHSQQIIVSAVIAWSSGDELSGYRYGIKFLDVPADVDLLLRAFVYLQLSNHAS